MKKETELQRLLIYHQNVSKNALSKIFHKDKKQSLSSETTLMFEIFIFLQISCKKWFKMVDKNGLNIHFY